MNPFASYLTSKKCKNVKNLFVSLINTIISYDCQGYGIPYMSSISTQGDTETLTTLALHALLILIEYKPPSLENLKYLIAGGHTTLNKIYDSLLVKFTTEDCVVETLHASIYDDLTVNEYARMFKVVHGRINMDPLFHGLVQYFKNVLNAANTSIPGSIT